MQVKMGEVDAHEEASQQDDSCGEEFLFQALIPAIR